MTSPPSLRVDVRVGQSVHCMRLPRQGRVKERSYFSGSTRILTIKILQGVWCMIQILSWFPSVLTLPITFPTNEEFESTTEEFTVSDVVNFVLFLTIDGDRIRGRQQEPIYFISFICRETIDVKGVMYL